MRCTAREFKGKQRLWRTNYCSLRLPARQNVTVKILNHASGLIVDLTDFSIFRSESPIVCNIWEMHGTEKLNFINTCNIIRHYRQQFYTGTELHLIFMSQYSRSSVSRYNTMTIALWTFAVMTILSSVDNKRRWCSKMLNEFVRTADFHPIHVWVSRGMTLIFDFLTLKIVS